MLARVHVLRAIGILAAACVAAGAAVIATPARAQSFDCTGIPTSVGEELRAELVLSNLTKPVDVQAPPGDTERLFIVEQRGLILILRLENDSLVSQPFLDIVDRVDDGGEKGLLGLAFHPNYAENGYFFVNYTHTGGPTSLQTTIARYHVSATDPNVASTDETPLLTFDQPYSNHNGGQLVFGPLDGYLYASTGDGGDAGDPENRAQNPEVYLGKLLRFDVDGGSPYAIPSTNPFAGDDGMLDEIWALGLRNPWRIAFDPETGDLYIADVGQDDWEELDFQPASSSGAENYEWKVRESNHEFRPTVDYGPGSRVSPILEYPHSGGAYNGCSITGGLVYRGCSMPDLRGTYFFADYCSDFIRSCRVVDGKVTALKNRTAELNAGLGNDLIDDISTFGADGRGELYICDLRNTKAGETSAKLFRIVSKNPPGEAPKFIRGNANSDDGYDLSDAINTLGYLFLGSPRTVPCQDALDANDDGLLDLADPIWTLNALFQGSAMPPAPHAECGVDPTEDELGCETSTCG
jgi:hypothetical protein